ncbi:MAG: 2-amino-4-hydroxy-6-hydroxymethyldihydropteridine diphosphokinase, partial [Kangiellaceae bacterium]|nr:2-amino-4-hydroxy-6-hydroxymethyldihydropteridine diphosphokinase [Kangiellaceae bacterium]
MIVYLGLGSNIEPIQNIAKTKQALTKDFPSVKFSRSFESEAVGFEGDNFINLVARIDTELSLEELIQYLKTLEDSLGRVRGGAKFSSRHIDIDILLYGNLICKKPI